ncbi:MAG: UDP-2,3-diacylglucosamine diphosphatase [Ignavibacteriales bacterium]|nr:UDP-2,3-diacylglucosamine diphosphatase [Ignavibacteriales bacterium]
MNDSYLFISDIHLGLQSKELEDKKERLLVKFLEFALTEAKELFILGDLFDYWFEYKRVYQKGFFRTLTALQNISENNVKIHYLIGNHDFLHRDFFTKEIGCILYENPFEIILNKKKFFLAHGDGMVNNDLGYKILKKILRNKVVQKIYSVVHPDWGIALASKTSQTSRGYTTQKHYGEIDGLFEAAKLKIDDGFDYVLMGHSHYRANKKYKQGTYINLGSWLSQPCYGIFSDNKFEIRDWN